MWSEIHIPDETDLPKALENGNLYNTSEQDWSNINNI